MKIAGKKIAGMQIGRQIMTPAYIRPDQAVALAALAKRLEVSKQSLIRDGLDLVFKKHGETRHGEYDGMSRQRLLKIIKARDKGV